MLREVSWSLVLRSWNEQTLLWGYVRGYYDRLHFSSSVWQV
jgi:hypothetical protein